MAHRLGNGILCDPNAALREDKGSRRRECFKIDRAPARKLFKRKVNIGFNISKNMFTTEDERTGRFTFEAEGHTNPTSPYYIGKLSHPSAQSGVTIGAGYDMGGRTEAVIKVDLIAAGVGADLAGKLSKGAGLKFAAAETFVTANKAALTISDVGVLRRLFQAIYPKYVATAQSCFDYHAKTFKASMKGYNPKYANATFFDWQYLFPAIRVVAVDFVYQGFGKMATGFGKPLHFCMANDFDWVIEYIEKTPGLSKYEAGRGRASYLRSRKAAEVSAFSKCGS